MTIAAHLLAPALIILAAWAGLTQAMGAHPFWSLQVALIGAPIGAVLSALLLVLRVPKLPRSLLWAVLTIAAFALTSLGKQRFAASYAEDAFAGQLWYFGWITTCACAAAFLASLASAHRAQK